MTLKSNASFKPTDLWVGFFTTEGKKPVIKSSHAPLVSWGKSLPALAGDGLRWIPASDEVPAKLAILTEFKTVNGHPTEGFRRAGATVARQVRGKDTGTLGIDLTGLSPDADQVRAFAEGFFLGLYQFDLFKSDRKKTSLSSVFLYQSTVKDSVVKKVVAEAEILTDSQIWARNLVNRPANDLTATGLAKEVSERAGKSGFQCTVLDKKKIKSLKMGGLLAVNKGSANEPVFIIAEYKSKGYHKAPVALVGKGVMFDTGGISIKPSAGMGDMKGDMAGAAAVLATIDAIARLGLTGHVIALVPATDNMPSGTAQCPGDIITTLSGLTVEVDNTDAEGRLILADALHYAKQYKPAAIIDLATLTGACVVALGTQAAGLMSNQEPLQTALQEAGKTSYERVWPLPLFDEYAPQIKSDVADIKNVGGRNAGAITAGKFLQRFVDDTQPWAHIDIAGPSYLESGDHYLPKGGTGFGVRLLVQYLKDRQ
ncbi:MAG: leucyl aminopeptidase [Bacteroidetes bacterium]|nr:leucyl aminopeptidase [Bacteroidota bacterium]